MPSKRCFHALVALPAAVLLLATACAAQPALKGVDLYQSDQLTTEEVRAEFQNDLEALAEAQSDGDYERFGALYTSILEGVRAKGNFAYVDLSPVQYYRDGDDVFYVTVDVVDVRDSTARMRFRPPPADTLADPGDLIAAWQDYQQEAIALLRSDQLPPLEDGACPALHCLTGFDHPALEPYLERFEHGVPQHRAALTGVLRRDAREAHRAAAAFLLAHTSNAQALADSLLPALRDPSSTVRNNAVRVLMALAWQGADLPPAPFVEALRYPSTTDRNKAAYVLDALARRPGAGAEIMPAVPALLDLLRLQQPNNHAPAYSILKKLSGKDFGERDYAAWERWATRAMGEKR